MAAALSNTPQDVQNLETYCLIWLDPAVNDSEENLLAQEQFRTAINHLVTLEDDQQCLEFIQSVPKDDRIILIVNEGFGRIIVPQIVQFTQIISIYVYCTNETDNEQWTRPFNKVKSVITDLDELIHQIRTDQHERKHNKIDQSLSFSVLNSTNIDQGKSPTEQFLHSQLLINCLINMNPSLDEKKGLITLCKQYYEGNPVVCMIIREFERDYSSDDVLSWYRIDSFLYDILNKALRRENIHLLFLFRFFIRDIEQQLEENKCSTPVKVYRGQLMSNDEVQILKDSLGEFIAINSFLSTSLNREDARSFVLSDDDSNDVQRVFFEIDADPRLENIKPFSLHSSDSEEEEILFMIGSIFRIAKIDLDEDGILIIQMKLCSYNNRRLQSSFQRIEEKYTIGETDLLEFGRVLKEIGKWDNAEKYYQRFLNQEANRDKDIAKCYHELGWIAKKKGDYESSLTYYNKSLEIKTEKLKKDYPSIALTHNSIGIVYRLQEDYAYALLSCKKALTIYKRLFGENHPNVAMCINNMGIIYEKQHLYPMALELYEKALSIWKEHRPVNHHDFGRAYKNIGSIHISMDEYNLALSRYKLSLEMYKKSPPGQHLSIASIQRCIGLIYKHTDNFEQAREYFEKAATIYRHSLPSTHPDVIQIERDIRHVSPELN